jgi:hypothetical protein
MDQAAATGCSHLGAAAAQNVACGRRSCGASLKAMAPARVVAAPQRLKESAAEVLKGNQIIEKLQVGC